MNRIKLLILLFALSATARGQIVLSGNENKIDLATGNTLIDAYAEPDSLSIFDFSTFPPRVQHLMDVPNTVFGPPSNIGITPDGRLALLASSLKIDLGTVKGWVPDTLIHVVDLTTDPPEVIDQVRAGLQASGISIHPNGSLALVANRAAGTVTVLNIADKKVTAVKTIEVAQPEDSLSDVAISPDGTLALVTLQKAHQLRILKINRTSVTSTEKKLSVCGRPYRCVITPDGQLGLTAGAGEGIGSVDTLTVVDLQASPIRTTDYVELGVSGPESLEVSPNGKLVAVVLMNGSNLTPDDPLRTENGMLVLLARRNSTYVKVQQVPISRIPEGVAFTSNGKYLLAQCHPSRETWVFSVDGERIEDTGHRITTPGFPSSMRAGRTFVK